MVGLGTRAGVPDLELVHKCAQCGFARASFVELKAKNGRLSADQQQMHWKLQDCGAPVLLCRTLDEVATGLRALGINLRVQLT
jgi:hypothetical protein